MGMMDVVDMVDVVDVVDGNGIVVVAGRRHH